MIAGTASLPPAYANDDAIKAMIHAALLEDLGPGDHSTLACIPAESMGTARLIVKDTGVLAGVAVALHIFKAVDAQLQVEVLMQDGSAIKPGDIVLTVHGSSACILMAERLVLNCMQRMSGIATNTSRYVEAIAGTGAVVLDTRKTTPNFRLAEKWAVLIGGGGNHRFALYDMVMLKDNHVDFAGGITAAVLRTAEYLKEKGLDLAIEVETRSMEEVEEALSLAAVNRIMLDNMDLDTMRAAVQLINKRKEVEASGGITLDTIRAVAETGVDFISCGAVIYNAKPLDLSLKAI